MVFASAEVAGIMLIFPLCTLDVFVLIAILPDESSADEPEVKLMEPDFEELSAVEAPI